MPRFTHLARLAGTSLLLGSLWFTPAAAQNQIKPDAVVAVVNGKSLTYADLLMTFDTLPQQYRQVGIGPVYNHIIERLVEQELLSGAARASNVEANPAYKQQLSFITKGLQEQFYLDSVYAERITDSKLQAAYDAFTPAVETQASHILVETEEAAKAIITELNGGADFAETAKQKSTGPSGPSGGDLGFFTADRMVPPFSQAAFALEPGSITQAPVKTQFGWHVIKVVDRRQAPKPPIEQMRGPLSLQAQEEVLDQLLGDLKAKAAIERKSLEELAK